MNPNFRSSAIALTFVLVASVAVGAYFAFHAPPAAVPASAPITAVTKSAPREVPSGTREYRSVAYHVSLLYPEGLSVAERTENGGARTIVFQNPDTQEGFQIFIVPYTDAKVSQARFRADLPTGVRENEHAAIVGGVPGASFDSTDLSLGETREIWFIHGGYLYEVTSLRTLDTWLNGIMETWLFL
ncbi:MAG: hypothetical protein JWL82_219 [Parcubacteria group bacterium]|nr:hypothetical protein [Parcubacteria group bacterium]